MKQQTVLRRMSHLGLVGVLVLSLTVSPILARAAEQADQKDQGERAQEVAQIPVLGHPYFSRTSRGSLFVGTFQITQFIMKDSSELRAQGNLRDKHRIQPAEFSVEVKEATCDKLVLHLHPTSELGLFDALAFVKTNGGTEEEGKGGLTAEDFCNISAAHTAGDLPTLMDLLNAPSVGCSFGCALAIITCGIAGVFGPSVEVACFCALGASECFNICSGLPPCTSPPCAPGACPAE
jgi:hypothetical protein